MSMRFGFEHDDFSDDDFPPNVQTDQTASKNTAPTADPSVGGNAATENSESSSTRKNVAESDSTTSFQALLADYLAGGANRSQHESTHTRYGSTSAQRESSSSPYESTPARHTPTSFHRKSKSSLTENRSKRSTPRESTTPTHYESHNSTSVQHESVPARYVSTTTHNQSDPSQDEATSTQRESTAISTQQTTSAEPDSSSTHYESTPAQREPHKLTSTDREPTPTQSESVSRDYDSTPTQEHSNKSISTQDESTPTQRGLQEALTSSQYESTTSTQHQEESTNTPDEPSAAQHTPTSVASKSTSPSHHGPQEASSSSLKESATSSQHHRQEPLTSSQDESTTPIQHRQESTATRRDLQEAPSFTRTQPTTTTQHEPTLTNIRSPAATFHDSSPSENGPRKPYKPRESTPVQHDLSKSSFTQSKSTSSQYGSISNQNSSGSDSHKPPSESTVTQQGRASDKPLPVKQLLLLCFDRAIEPIVFFSIFPFVNQMIVKVSHVPPSDTGFYAGLIESLFSLTQMFVMIIWGRLSDRIGRKPVLVVSLFGVGFAAILFGLAQTIWQMILFRCIAGLFAGSIVTIRTMISEHSTAKTQARAFAWFAFFGNLGIFLGPLIGGALADPNQLYSHGNHRIRFFDWYPYSLPMFVTGALALIAATLTMFFVDETYNPKWKSLSRSDPDPECAPLIPQENINIEHNGNTTGSTNTPGGPTLPKTQSGFDLLEAPETSSTSGSSTVAGIPQTPGTSGLRKTSVGLNLSEASGISSLSRSTATPGLSKASGVLGLPRPSNASGDPNPPKTTNAIVLLQNPSIFNLLKAPGVLPVLCIYGHCMVLGYAYTAIAPTFFFEPVSLGGFGFTSSFISLFLAITGAGQAFWLLLIFPPLQHRIGTGGVLRLCAYVWPLSFLCFPLLNILLRINTLATTTIFWTLGPIMLCAIVGVSMAFTSVQLALNDISPDPRVMGTLNSLALTIMSGLRSFTPAAFGAILAAGVKYQVVWGYLVWVVMITVAVGFVFGVRWLPEKAEGRVYEEVSVEQME